MGTNSSSGPGVAGTSSSGFGLSGLSKTGHGINGTSASSFGVVGITTENATSTAAARAGVLGQDSSTNKKAYNSGVAGTSKYGLGVTGTGGSYGGFFTGGRGLFSSGIDSDPERLVALGITGGAAVNAYGTYDDGGALPFPPASLFTAVGCFITPYAPNPTPGACGAVATIYSDGTASFGTITQNGSTLVRTKTTTGSDVVSFGARAASPTLEDFGTATLHNGTANVVLEKTFASTISPTYMVFVTPHGDSNGLYATVSPTSFAVHENKNGRSTLTFDYRIVARPLDAKVMHLPSTGSFPLFAKHIAHTTR